MINNGYRIVRLIGRGQQADVYEIEESITRNKFALKVSGNVTQLKEEAWILRKINKKRDAHKEKYPESKSDFVAPFKLCGTLEIEDGHYQLFFFVIPLYEMTLESYVRNMEKVPLEKLIEILDLIIQVLQCL